MYGWIPLFGYPRDSRVNYVRFHGFLRSVSYSFQTYEKRYRRFRSNEILNCTPLGAVNVTNTMIKHMGFPLIRARVGPYLYHNIKVDIAFPKRGYLCQVIFSHANQFHRVQCYHACCVDVLVEDQIACEVAWALHKSKIYVSGLVNSRPFWIS